MSFRSKAKKLAILMAHPEILLAKKKYLFVISHMRSRSSVLSHILGSNPEICGYKELHRSYKGSRSLINMQIELVTDLKCNVRNKYLLDKLLNNFTITDWVLENAQPRILFLLREPEATLKSIINMGVKTGVQWYQDPEKITEYYCKRLKNIEHLAARLDGNYLFLDSDSLIINPEETLSRISNWLNLKVPLKREYSTFSDTGIIGYGDPLDNIKSGELKATMGYPKIQIPRELLDKAEMSYHKCHTKLLKSENNS